MDHTPSRALLVAAPSPPAQEQAAFDSALFQTVAFLLHHHFHNRKITFRNGCSSPGGSIIPFSI
jgi:hypothetical protein